MASMNITLCRVTILLHGRLADVLGRSIEVHAPERCSIAELRRRIAAERPASAEAILSPRVRPCVGDALVPESFRPTPGDTVEFLPPVSGG